MSGAAKDQIMKQLSGMSEEEQWRILEITGPMSAKPGEGVSGGSLLRFAGTISTDDARRMSEAIEESCRLKGSTLWRAP